jgi:hypothetical protein
MAPAQGDQPLNTRQSGAKEFSWRRACRKEETLVAPRGARGSSVGKRLFPGSVRDMSILRIRVRALRSVGVGK